MSEYTAGSMQKPIEFQHGALSDLRVLALGQHDDEVHGTLLNFPPERIADLRTRGVI